MEIKEIAFHKGVKLPEKQDQAKFSILIPTWNNLPYLKTCIASILKNSRHQHQIVVHINDGSDGTLDWVKEKGFDYTHSENNTGVCFAFNAAASLAKTEFLLLIDDDNYVLPDWDYFLWEEVQQIGHPYFAVSATKIENKKTFNPCVIAPHNFGNGLDDFKEEEILGSYKDLKFQDWNGSSWYPMVVHKHIWDLVGGMSVEYTPGMYSDPDFMMKLWKAGVRYFKGVNNSRTYHFMSRSVRRIKKNNGRKQFLLKWGMSNSTFRDYYLRMDSKFLGKMEEPEMTLKLKMRMMRDRLKIFFSF
jgi:glycosyltransferase involved in cell wall biosynthesis